MVAWHGVAGVLGEGTTYGLHHQAGGQGVQEPGFVFISLGLTRFRDGDARLGEYQDQQAYWGRS